MKNTKMDREYIGRAIRTKRRSLGMRQNFLAERVGISTNSLCMIETGKTFPHYETMLRLMDELGLSFMIVERGARNSMNDSICEIGTRMSDDERGTIGDAIGVLSRLIAK